MKAIIAKITPKYAKELLEQNTNNRPLKVKSIARYVHQMENGLWKENGEPIIIDTEGVIKDGQHRLEAVIKANYTYNCPIIYDVEPQVMDTIDTGSNRSLGDVLALNDFKYIAHTASFIKVIMHHDLNLNGSVFSGNNKYISNNAGLQYAIENKEELENFTKTICTLYKKGTIFLLSARELAWYSYAVNGLEINQEFLTFLEGIITGNLGEESCTYYGYTKLLHAKTKQITLHSVYKFNLVMRLWEIYQNDVPIKKLQIKTDTLIKLK